MYRRLLLLITLSGVLVYQAVAWAGPGAGNIHPGYLLNPEDSLLISVWNESNLQLDVAIRPDGKISFPLVGHIQAAGRTPEELEQEITEKLKKYIPEPVVTVVVTGVNGNEIYIIGDVSNPGKYQVGHEVNVLQALALAGGLGTYAAENKIKILRRENGKDIVFRFRYSDVEDGENLEQNILLKAGDVVVVP